MIPNTNRHPKMDFFMTTLIALIVASVVGVTVGKLNPILALVLWFAAFFITKRILDKYRP
jgi:uncharacterized membrane protein YccC